MAKGKHRKKANVRALSAEREREAREIEKQRQLKARSDLQLLAQQERLSLLREIERLKEVRDSQVAADVMALTDEVQKLQCDVDDTTAKLVRRGRDKQSIARQNRLARLEGYSDSLEFMLDMAARADGVDDCYVTGDNLSPAGASHMEPQAARALSKIRRKQSSLRGPA